MIEEYVFMMSSKGRRDGYFHLIICGCGLVYMTHDVTAAVLDA